MKIFTSSSRQLQPEFHELLQASQSFRVAPEENFQTKENHVENLVWGFLDVHQYLGTFLALYIFQRIVDLLRHLFERMKPRSQGITLRRKLLNRAMYIVLVLSIFQGRQKKSPNATIHPNSTYYTKIKPPTSTPPAATAKLAIRPGPTTPDKEEALLLDPVDVAPVEEVVALPTTALLATVNSCPANEVTWPPALSARVMASPPSLVTIVKIDPASAGSKICQCQF